MMTLVWIIAAVFVVVGLGMLLFAAIGIIAVGLRR